MNRVLALAVSVLLLAGVSVAQVQPGYPSFAAYDAHEIDTINLLNNNIIINAPGFSKPGVLPVGVNLFNNYYETKGTVWNISTYDSITQLTTIAHALSYGFDQDFTTTSVQFGYSHPALCPDGSTETTEYHNFFITDSYSTVHWLPASDYVDSQGCYFSTFTDQTTDGSHLTLTESIVSQQPKTIGVYDSSGTTFGTSALSVTDVNGNALLGTYNGSTLTLKDTLGIEALTAIGSPLSSLSWTDVDGRSPQISVTTSGTGGLRSNFGCSGVADYDIGTAGTATSGNIGYPDTTSMSITFEATPGYSGFYTGRPNVITLRQGGTITYSYLGNNNGIDCTYANVPELKRVTSDGTTTYTLTHSSIGGGNYSATNTVIDNGGNKTVYTFTGFTSTGVAGFPTGQVLTEVARYQGASTLLTTDVYCYNTAFASCSFVSAPSATITLPITSRIVMHKINGMSNASATETHYDAYGNVTYSAQYDFGGTSPTKATTITYGSCSAKCTTTTPTISAIGSNINNKPGDILTTGTGSTISERRYTYNSHGHITTTYLWTGTAWLSNATPNLYNANGTPSTTYDLSDNATTYSYTASGYLSCPTGGCTTYPYPTSISAVGLTRSSIWNAIGGVKVSDTDANGNVTSYCYTSGTGCSGGTADSFWRPLSITDEALGNTVVYAYPNGSAPDSSSSSFEFNSNNSIQKVVTTTDGYGRQVSVQKKQSPTSAQYDTVTTSYGWSTGYREVSTSQPCSTTSGATCPIVHSNLFDPLGRLYQRTTTGNEALTHTYTQNDDLAILSPPPSGENNKQVQSQYDGLGRRKQSCAIGNGSMTPCGQNTGSADGVTTSTSYTYASGSSTVTSTRGVQTRSKTYDGMGRVIKSVIPETGTLVSGSWVPGTWNYYYDTAACPNSGASPGNLTCSTDPNGVTTIYFYDGLNRLHDINAGYCRRFRYDSGSNAVTGSVPSGVTLANVSGRMVEAETDNCINPITPITDEWFSYDADGHMTDMWEMTPHSGGYYHTTVTYSGNGVVNSLSGIPGYSAYTYTLDGEGRPYGVTQSTSSIINSVTYNAASKPTTITYFNGDTDTYAYDPSTGRTTNYTFNVASTSDSGTLTWNPNGTLQKLVIADNVQLASDSQTCNFGYDDLTRLVTDSCGSQWSQTYSYDQYDNLNKTGNPGGTWLPGYNPTNNHYSSIGATYDSNGKLIYDSFNTYTWDGYGKMSSVQSGTSQAVCGSSGTCVTYDANGRPVETNVAGVFSEILYSPMGETAIMSGASTVTVSYIPMPGGGYMWANTAGGANQVLQHRDWLGSVRLEINPGLGVDTTRSVHAYSPFGGNVRCIHQLLRDGELYRR